MAKGKSKAKSDEKRAKTSARKATKAREEKAEKAEKAREANEDTRRGSPTRERYDNGPRDNEDADIGGEG